MSLSDEQRAEQLAKLKDTLVGTPAPAHKGGYLTQDEYATLIYYWAGEEHESDVVDGVIATLANSGWAWAPERILQTAAVVAAFGELFPEKRFNYPALCQACSRAVRETPQSDPGWNQFHLTQWFILRRARREEGIDIIDKLLDRVAEGGEIGYEAQRWINGVAHGASGVEGCKPFEIALQRARAARLEKMVIQ